ncbi:activator-dependent family glycosyltransferase [Streptomyces sp. AK010]|uniref:activator-dependent family glycosyltransferase n=1 Tax=Streptomyces sp. AK010 TaxID=2723074 RepID=UPI001615AD66|nr:activator-dependent family glycosyltransferase [Streptomyces sp. AK010]MBB6421390.1 glycosyltransferase (activator-dependent family) [Streptomyces sp. AK010]
MRVLFATYAERTHFLAMAPLAWALRTAGHEVRFAGQPTFTDEITQAGLTAVGVGRSLDPARMMELAPDDAGRAGLPEPYDVATRLPEQIAWGPLRDAYARQVRHWHRVENVPMVADLVAFARSWQPDLVIWEPTTFAGAIAAKACGAAHARLMFGLDVYGVTRDHFLRLRALQPATERADPLGEWLASYGRRYGFDFSEDLVTGHFTIDQLPGSVRMEADLRYVPMRYVPFGGPAVVPRWLWAARPERPRVALSFGLVATERYGGYVVGVREILESLADLDVEVVATIAESEQSKLGTVPGNASVVSYVPLHALVPTCSAVIHHAGFGTLSTVALHGVPQLLLPVDSDAPELARRLVAQGGARCVPAGEATGPVVRERLVELLSEPSFREGARRLRAQVHDMPAPNQLVAHLEQLTAAHRGRPAHRPSA